MTTYRFGLNKLPELGRIKAGLKSKFGLKPLEITEAATEEIPIISGGFVYTIDKRGTSPDYEFYFLEYNAATGAFIREALITDLHAGASTLFLVADQTYLYVFDTGWWQVNKILRSTLEYDSSLLITSTFTFPGWPYNCYASTPFRFTSDADNLYILWQWGGRDETGQGNNSSWSSANMRLRKSDLSIQDFADGGWWISSAVPAEGSCVAGSKLIHKKADRVFRAYNISDLSLIGNSPTLDDTIYQFVSDLANLYVYSYGKFLQIDPATWTVLLEGEIDPFASAVSLAASPDSDFIFAKTGANLSCYNKADLTFVALLNTELPSTAMRLAIVNP